MTTLNTLFIDTRHKGIAHVKSIIVTAVSVALLIGCASTQADSSELSDANIAAIVVGANKIDISAGEIALVRSENTKVKEFAQLMVTDHNAVLDSAVELVTRLGVTPVNNDLVATLAAQSVEHEANLMNLSGEAFDKAYIDHEVTYHQAVIGVIENQLIPAAQNQELKDTLVSVVPAFKAHLEHCQMIQSSM